jgi:hypothetical protein
MTDIFESNSKFERLNEIKLESRVCKWSCLLRGRQWLVSKIVETYHTRISPRKPIEGYLAVKNRIAVIFTVVHC